MYEKARKEGAVPWNDSEGHDSPHDLAWSLRDMFEENATGGFTDYVTSVARTQDGAAFLVKFKTGKLLRVSVSVAEPSPRFYPAEGEPDKREKKDFEETFDAQG